MAKLFNRNKVGPDMYKGGKTFTENYQGHLRAHHEANPLWAKGKPKFAGADILGIIRARGYIRSILDYGCGKGGFGVWLKEFYPEVQYFGYDPGILGKEKLPDRKFDLVMTTDVMEHIEPALVDNTIQQLWDLTKTVMYNNIACTPTDERFKDEGEYKGESLHLSVHTPEEWRDRFMNVLGDDPKYSPFEWSHRTRRWHSEMRPRCVMVDERSG